MSRRGRKKALFKLKLRVETVHSLAALTLFAFGGLLVISFSGQGALLQSINDVLRQLFGVAALIVPFLFFSAGLVLTGAKWSFAKPQVLLGGILLLIALATLGQTGSIGMDLFANVSALIQPIGTYVSFSLLAIAAFLILTDTSIREIFRFFTSMIEVQSGPMKDKGLNKITLNGMSNDQKLQAGQFKIKGSALSPQNEEQQKLQQKDEKDKMSVNAPKQKAPAGDIPALALPSSGKALSNAPGDIQVWQYPTPAIFNPKTIGHADRGDIKANAAVIEKTLNSFGIRAYVREVNCGPAVTQYALEITLGTKLLRLQHLPMT